MKDLKSAVLLFAFLALLTGGLYPAAVTVAANFLFSRQAEGSLIADGSGRIIGSTLIGQPFTAEEYFWSRPSAAGGAPYNSLASGGSNLGSTNPALIRQVGERVNFLRQSGMSEEIPADLVTASASGLDPHISPEAATLQIPRVAKARNISVDRLQTIVAKNIEGRQLGVFGMPRVNVLALNLTLDREMP